MPHIVLLGDSIFDNAAYVPGGPDVVTQLRDVLPAGWEATLAAVDGAVITDVARQIPRISRAATHLVLSVGGNDALGHVDILERPARSVAEVLDLLADISGRFGARYRAMLSALLRLDLPVVVCTVYDGALPEPALQRRASTALTVFNDAILRTAFDHGADVIDLRRICAEPGDYANPIEPSVQGGAKIAQAIAQAVVRERDAHAGVRVFPDPSG